MPGHARAQAVQLPAEVVQERSLRRPSTTRSHPSLARSIARARPNPRDRSGDDGYWHSSPLASAPPSGPAITIRVKVMFKSRSFRKGPGMGRLPHHRRGGRAQRARPLGHPLLRANRPHPRRADTERSASLPAGRPAPDRLRPHCTTGRDDPRRDRRPHSQDLPADRAPTAQDWKRLTAGWQDQLDQRIAVLEALRSGLSSCIGCGCLSLRTCRLANPDDEAAGLGPGPQYLLPG